MESTLNSSTNKKSQLNESRTWSVNFIEGILKEVASGKLLLENVAKIYKIPLPLLKSYKICYGASQKLTSINEMPKIKNYLTVHKNKQTTYKNQNVIKQKKFKDLNEFELPNKDDFFLCQSLDYFKQLNSPVHLLEKFSFFFYKSVLKDLICVKNQGVIQHLNIALNFFLKSKVSISRVAAEYKITEAILNYFISLRHDAELYEKIIKILESYYSYLADCGYRHTELLATAFIERVFQNEKGFKLIYKNKIYSTLACRVCKEWSQRFFVPDSNRATLNCNQFHNEFIRIMSKINLKQHPYQIFNSGEVKLFLRKDKKIPHYITVHACVSATGQCFPFQIIFPENFSLIIEKEIIHGTSSQGLMNSFHYLKWFDYFLRHCGQNRPVILIQNNFLKYVNKIIISKAIQNKIIHLNVMNEIESILPVHISILQPINSWYLMNSYILTHENFLHLFFEEVQKNCCISNITSGFRLCGIWPSSEFFGTTITPNGQLQKNIKIDLSALSGNNIDNFFRLSENVNQHKNKKNPECKQIDDKKHKDEAISYANNYQNDNQNTMITNAGSANGKKQFEHIINTILFKSHNSRQLENTKNQNALKKFNEGLSLLKNESFLSKFTNKQTKLVIEEKELDKFINKTNDICNEMCSLSKTENKKFDKLNPFNQQFLKVAFKKDSEEHVFNANCKSGKILQGNLGNVFENISKLVKLDNHKGEKYLENTGKDMDSGNIRNDKFSEKSLNHINGVQALKLNMYEGTENKIKIENSGLLLKSRLLLGKSCESEIENKIEINEVDKNSNKRPIISDKIYLLNEAEKNLQVNPMLKSENELFEQFIHPLHCPVVNDIVKNKKINILQSCTSNEINDKMNEHLEIINYAKKIKNTETNSLKNQYVSIQNTIKSELKKKDCIMNELCSTKIKKDEPEAVISKIETLQSESNNQEFSNIFDEKQLEDMISKINTQIESIIKSFQSTDASCNIELIENVFESQSRMKNEINWDDIIKEISCEKDHTEPIVGNNSCDKVTLNSFQICDNKNSIFTLMQPIKEINYFEDKLNNKFKKRPSNNLLDNGKNKFSKIIKEENFEEINNEKELLETNEVISLKNLDEKILQKKKDRIQSCTFNKNIGLVNSNVIKIAENSLRTNPECLQKKGPLVQVIDMKTLKVYKNIPIETHLNNEQKEHQNQSPTKVSFLQKVNEEKQLPLRIKETDIKKIINSTSFIPDTVYSLNHSEGKILKTLIDQMKIKSDTENVKSDMDIQKIDESQSKIEIKKVKLQPKMIIIERNRERTSPTAIKSLCYDEVVSSSTTNDISQNDNMFTESLIDNNNFQIVQEEDTKKPIIKNIMNDLPRIAMFANIQSNNSEGNKSIKTISYEEIENRKQLIEMTETKASTKDKIAIIRKQDFSSKICQDSNQPILKIENKLDSCNVEKQIAMTKKENFYLKTWQVVDETVLKKVNNSDTLCNTFENTDVGNQVVNKHILKTENNLDIYNNSKSISSIEKAAIRKQDFSEVCQAVMEQKESCQDNSYKGAGVDENLLTGTRNQVFSSNVCQVGNEEILEKGTELDDNSKDIVSPTSIKCQFVQVIDMKTLKCYKNIPILTTANANECNEVKNQFSSEIPKESSEKKLCRAFKEQELKEIINSIPFIPDEVYSLNQSEEKKIKTIIAELKTIKSNSALIKTDPSRQKIDNICSKMQAEVELKKSSMSVHDIMKLEEHTNFLSRKELHNCKEFRSKNENNEINLDSTAKILQNEKFFNTTEFEEAYDHDDETLDSPEICEIKKNINSWIESFKDDDNEGELEREVKEEMKLATCLPESKKIDKINKIKAFLETNEIQMSQDLSVKEQSKETCYKEIENLLINNKIKENIFSEIEKKNSLKRPANLKYNNNLDLLCEIKSKYPKLH